MRRRTTATPGSPARVGLGLASLALSGLLLLGFKGAASSVAAGARTTGTSGSSGTTGASGSSGTTGTTSGAASAASSGSSSSSSQTIDGAVVTTRFGPVEVEITVANGRVTAVTAIELPSGGRSGAISSYVAPVLSSEALSAQSAKIDIVSGATYTSEAYARSLQSALDQAGI